MKIQPVFEVDDRAILIAGPCSAESEEQVLESARRLAGVGIDLFRAGIWKPRTRPGTFAGVGSRGLDWLQRVQREVGLKVTTEVAKAKHVEEALNHGIDVLWLGARTTVSPFAVQEVADALRGSNVPVLVKNPINADVELWIGAIERLYAAGTERVAAVHRGFDCFGEPRYRYRPLWRLPLILKNRFPELQLICDHSHICGCRELLRMVAKRALALKFDGLMTEVHPTPDEARSDAAQQLTPVAYRLMVEEVGARVDRQANLLFFDSLDYVRERIDDIDNELLDLLGRRMELADEIGGYKKKHNISIRQNNRWREVVQHAVTEGEKRKLSRNFVETVLAAIHEESIAHQARVIGASD